MDVGLVILLVVVGVAALAAWPVCIRMARGATERERLRAQSPGEGQRREQNEYLQGTVVGGHHVGGGRSVAPRRDEEVIPLGHTPVDHPWKESRR